MAAVNFRKQPVNQNYFNGYNAQQQAKDQQLLGNTPPPSVPVGQAQQAYQQAFPRPNTMQGAVNNVTPVPQLQQPQKQYQYEKPQVPMFMQIEQDYQQKNNPTGFDVDQYKDNTPDGLARNYLTTFAPKTEEDYSKENETTKRILAIGNALRHIGNIVNTSKGGPVQIFNDPVALQQAKYDKEKAERVANAQREAQMERQRMQDAMNLEKLNMDKAMNEFKINMGTAEAKRKADKDANYLKLAQDKAKFDEDYKNRSLASDDAYKQGLLNQGDKRLAETARHNRATEGLSSQRLAVSWYNATHKGKGGGGGSGSGRGSGGGRKGKAIIATSKGYLAGKTDLNSTQYKQLWSYLVSHGHITKAKQAEYMAALNPSQQMDIIKKAVGWAAMNDRTQRGDAFRKVLHDHFGLWESDANGNEIGTVTPKATPKAQPKATHKVTPKATSKVTPKVQAKAPTPSRKLTGPVRPTAKVAPKAAPKRKSRQSAADVQSLNKALGL